MQAKLISEAHGDRTFVLVFETDDEVLEGLLEHARTERLSSATFTGIGAFRSVTLGYFELDRRDYLRIPLEEQVEVLSLTGNIALADGEPKVHAHVVVGRKDGTAHGGHLLDARVRPTLELVLVEAEPHLRRVVDPNTGLPLIRPDL